MSRLEVAVVGCGHMGTHHARIVAAHPDCRLVAVVDVIPERARRLAAQHGVEALEVAPDGVGAVIVATPTVTHLEVAGGPRAAGSWVLVEKPLADTVEAATALLGPRVVVGHVERFNPAVRAVGALAPVWIEARRIARPRGRALDVDVVRDLMVHDLDLVRAWGGDDVVGIEVDGVQRRGTTIEAVRARLVTTRGVRAELVASRIATSDTRRIAGFGPGRHVVLDLLAGRAWDGGVELPRRDDRDGLTAQWDAFVAAARGRAPREVPARDGLASVRLAARIVAHTSR